MFSRTLFTAVSTPTATRLAVATLAGRVTSFGGGYLEGKLTQVSTPGSSKRGNVPPPVPAPADRQEPQLEGTVMRFPTTPAATPAFDLLAASFDRTGGISASLARAGSDCQSHRPGHAGNTDANGADPRWQRSASQLGRSRGVPN